MHSEFGLINMAEVEESTDPHLGELEQLAEVPLDVLPPSCTDRVKRLGPNRLSKIIWQGRQWAVTTYGIECRDGRYFLKKGNLPSPHIIQHMFEKTWVDVDDFVLAYRVLVTLEKRRLA